ncbi:MAG: phospho-N-acetylmuramoyl-pentapeptide-transferase [Clostridia bacterium]|nr:phospho-N-acetylmuramoyl-pentapeptide-transferase [Clostridia bacterium]
MLDNYFPLYIIVFIFSLAITVITIKRLIPVLSRAAQQPIYADGPKWHLKKSGTPTMGGVSFIISVSLVISLSAIILLLLGESESATSLILCQLYAILNSIIGIIDDTRKLKKHQNKGLSAKGKLILQFVAAVLFLAARRLLLNDTTRVSFSFGEFDLGPFYYPICLFILLGIINCANLTDGIDGLASTVAFSIGTSLLYLSAALNKESSILASAIIGVTVGFLFFNLHPAKIFMGDTGSLFLGSLIACSCFTLNNPLIVIFIAGVYVIEGCSVILQVISYKLFKKRIFKMAPLHHHLEQCGLSENTICIIAIIVTFIFSIPAYIFYLP